MFSIFLPNCIISPPFVQYNDKGGEKMNTKQGGDYPSLDHGAASAQHPRFEQVIKKETPANMKTKVNAQNTAKNEASSR